MPEEMNSTSGPEVSRLADRLYNDPARRTVHFSVTTAHSMDPALPAPSAEEIAASVNAVLDELEDPRMDVASSLLGEASLLEDEIHVLTHVNRADPTKTPELRRLRRRASQYRRWADQLKAHAREIPHLRAATPGSLTLRTEVPETEQESGFANATLQSLGEGRAVSVALTLPDGVPQEPAALQKWLTAALSTAVLAGCNVEVWEGPERE